MTDSMPITEQQFVLKRIICPACKAEFKGWQPRMTALRIRREHSDLFYAEYDGPNPNHYSVVVCPACLYAAYDNDFAELSGSVKERVRADAGERRKLYGAHDFDGLRGVAAVQASYELALRCYAVRKRGRVGLRAALYLQMAWLACETHQPGPEREYLELALEHYRQSYAQESPGTAKDQIKQTFLIGDLSLRLGQFDEAVRWFQETVKHPAIGQFPELERRTRQRWSEARAAAAAAA